jgi:hypothetical protein
MKKTCKILAIIAVFALSFQPLSAQETSKWNAKLGGGFISVQDLFGLVEIGYDGIAGNQSDGIIKIYPLITPNFEVAYSFSDRVSLGLQVAIGYAGRYQTFENSTDREYTTILSPTLMANLNVTYFKKENFYGYGVFGIGGFYLGVFNSLHENSLSSGGIGIPMFNFYPFCFSTNRDNGFFMECGWGSKGLINLGWDIKF